MTVFSIEGQSRKLTTAEDAASVVTDIVAVGKALAELRLSGNTFGVDATKALAEALRCTTALHTCVLSDIFTGRLRSEIPHSLAAITDVLLLQPDLRYLDLGDNAFGPDGIRPLVPLIAASTNLVELRLNNTGLGPEGGAILADALAQNFENCQKSPAKDSSLRVIVCGRSRLENGSMEKLGAALASHKNLREVVLYQDGIRPEGICSLLASLKSCTDLEILDLQDNTFSFDGAKALADAISSWPKLKKLNVGDCLLTAKGALLFVEALEKAPFEELEVLNMQYNEMDEAGARALAKVLPRFTKLKSLELNGNAFREDGDAATAIREALEEMGIEDALGSLSDMEFSDDEDEDDESDSVAEKEDQEADELADELAKKATVS